MRYKDRHKMAYNHDGSFELMKRVEISKNTSGWKGEETGTSEFPEVV